MIVLLWSAILKMMKNSFLCKSGQSRKIRMWNASYWITLGLAARINEITYVKHLENRLECCKHLINVSVFCRIYLVISCSFLNLNPLRTPKFTSLASVWSPKSRLVSHSLSSISIWISDRQNLHLILCKTEFLVLLPKPASPAYFLFSLMASSTCSSQTTRVILDFPLEHILHIQS